MEVCSENAGRLSAVDNFSFRYAEEKDVPLVIDFVRELAEYEKLLDEVDTSEELYRRWLFEKQSAKVIFAMENGVEVGFALFFHNFSTFLGRSGIYLEDLFVKPEKRGRGYGNALLKKLAELAVEEGCGSLEFVCLDWNKPSIDFYRALGAKSMDDWTIYRFEGDSLEKLASFEE